MGMKPRKKPERKRTGESVVIWEGDDSMGPIRIVAIDESPGYFSNGLPCKVVVERGKLDAAGVIGWRETAANMLEKELGYALGITTDKMPTWGRR